MLNYLDKLRKKPEPERRKAVFMISAGVTLFIALIWGIVITMQISGTDFALKPDSAQLNVPSLVDTFSNFLEQVKRVVGSDEAATKPSASSTAQ